MRDEAISRIREISRILDRPYDDWILTSRREEESGLRSVTIALGRCGVALFYAWLARTGLDERAAECASRFLGESIELLPSKTLDASLFCGFPGVAWTTEHLLAMSGETGGEDPNAEIDDAIIGALEDATFVPAYDLIDGLAGIGVYALERGERNSGARIASLVLERLEETACPQSVGLSWPSGTLTRTAQGRGVLPEETYFNLGLSHGVPGVVGILARFVQRSDLRSRALPLLEGSVKWISAQRLPHNETGAFPDYVSPRESEPGSPARLAWCYGDPGVAAALVAAGRALERSEVTSLAMNVAHAAARRDFATTSVVDAGICHGSAGVAHILHRIHRASGDLACRDAAVAWFERLLTRTTDRPALAGFPTFCFERTQDGEYIEDPAWLTGAAGVGLVLLAAVSDLEPRWDRLLLLDLDA
jgi:lantibiotic modifying enzyme